MRASVVLPDPDWPTSATISPRPHLEVHAVDRVGDRAASANVTRRSAVRSSGSPVGRRPRRFGQASGLLVAGA